MANALVETQLGNIAAAKSSLENLIAEAPDNPELRVELAMSLAGAKMYKEANSEMRSAVSKFLSAGDRRTAAGAYVRLSIVLNSDSSDVAKKLQLECLNDALNLYRELRAPADEGSILVGLGDYFLRVSENTSAVDEYTKAKELAQNAGEKNILAQSLLGLGNAYQAQKDFAKASESHVAAATLFHELSNSVGETNSLRNLGRDYYLLNDPGKSLPALLGARNVANSAGPFYAYLAAYFLGDYYNSQGEYEKGLASFRDALEITTKADDTEHAAYSHLALAGVVGFLGAWEDSVTEAEIALKLFEQLGNREGQADCWAHLTSVYSDRTSSLKDFDKAQECYRKALDWATERPLGSICWRYTFKPGSMTKLRRLRERTFKTV